MFTEERFAQDVEMEEGVHYESIEVPHSYTGPHLSFPLLPDHATALVEAFRLRQVSFSGNMGPYQLVLMSKGSPNQPRKCSQVPGVSQSASEIKTFAIWVIHPAGS